MRADVLSEARDYARTYGGAGLVIRHGRLVLSWGDTRLRYDLKSTTKSIGATALGLATADRLLTFEDKANELMPGFGMPPAGNSATGWLEDITLLQLATHTSGFAKTGGYVALEHSPGTAWLYSDGGFNWLADVLTSVYGEDLDGLLFRRVFSRIGITRADLVWRQNRYRDATLNGIPRREFGSGIMANVDAMARIGYLYLRRGTWQDEQLIPTSFVDRIGDPFSTEAPPTVGGSHPAYTSSRYGVAWYTNSDGTLPEVPTDAFWAWGLQDSLIVVIPSLDIVAVRAGNGLGRTGWNADYSFIAPFVTPIARSVASQWLSFDGIDDVVSVTSSAMLEQSRQLTIEARIRPRTIATHNRRARILRKGTDYELMISRQYTGCPGATKGDLQLSLTIGGIVKKVCGGSLRSGAWQHVSGTYDGRELAVYVDGQRVGSLAATGTINRSTTMLTIGNIKALSRAYDGEIADIAVWNRALSAEEMKRYASEPRSGTEPGLVGYWSAREGIGQIVHNVIPFGRHGRLGLTNRGGAADPVWDR